MLRKSDLVDGCLVELRNYGICKYYENAGKFYNGITYFKIEDYSKDLKHYKQSGLDIVEIYYKNQPSKAENTLLDIFKDEKLLKAISSINSMNEIDKKYAIDLLKSGKVELEYFELSDSEKMNYILVKDILSRNKDYFKSHTTKIDIIDIAKNVSHLALTTHHVACCLNLTYGEALILSVDKYYGNDKNLSKGLSKFALAKSRGLSIEDFMNIHRQTTTNNNEMLKQFEVLI